MKDYSLLLAERPPAGDGYRFATVTQAGPVRIRLDGDTSPIEFSPVVLNGSPAPGDRVWVQIHGRQMIVLGVVNAGA